MAEAEFRARFRFSCEGREMSETVHKEVRRAQPALNLSDLYCERRLVLLVNGPLVDGVWHRQVDHLTVHTSKPISTQIIQTKQIQKKKLKKGSKEHVRELESRPEQIPLLYCVPL